MQPKSDWRSADQRRFCAEFCATSPEAPDSDDCRRCLIDCTLADLVGNWHRGVDDPKLAMFAHCADDQVALWVNWAALHYNKAKESGALEDRNDAP